MTPQHEHSVRITRGELVMEGILGLPSYPCGVVVFAHGSGAKSERFEYRLFRR